MSMSFYSYSLLSSPGPFSVPRHAAAVELPVDRPQSRRGRDADCRYKALASPEMKVVSSEAGEHCVGHACSQRSGQRLRELQPPVFDCSLTALV